MKHDSISTKGWDVLEERFHASMRDVVAAFGKKPPPVGTRAARFHRAVQAALGAFELVLGEEEN